MNLIQREVTGIVLHNFLGDKKSKIYTMLKPYDKSIVLNINKKLAEWTGLEPATPGVTGRYSNQLNYHS
jgi:hypothetical protein